MAKTEACKQFIIVIAWDEVTLHIRGSCVKRQLFAHVLRDCETPTDHDTLRKNEFTICSPFKFFVRMSPQLATRKGGGGSTTRNNQFSTYNDTMLRDKVEENVTRFT